MSAEDHQLSWRKSSRCDSGTCIEVALTESGVRLRGSEDPGRALHFSRAEWAEFVAALKRGELTD
jgi:hypothetical protein